MVQVLDHPTPARDALTDADGEAVDVVLAAEDRRHLSPGQRAMWRAKVMADAGLRSNGRWKRGSVDICGSANTGAVRTDMARSFRRAGMTAGLILDYLSDVVDDVIAGTACHVESEGHGRRWAASERQVEVRQQVRIAQICAISVGTERHLPRRPDPRLPVRRRAFHNDLKVEDGDVLLDSDYPVGSSPSRVAERRETGYDWYFPIMCSQFIDEFTAFTDDLAAADRDEERSRVEWFAEPIAICRIARALSDDDIDGLFSAHGS